MLVHAPTKTLLLKAKDPFLIRGIIPRFSRLGDYGDGHNVAIKHTLESTKLLRNLGFKVPSPIGAQYNWPGKHTPFDHQRVMADALTTHEKIFNLSEMGTGKTYASLWAADWLMREGIIHKALVIAPLSSLEATWEQDIFDILLHRQCAILHGSAETRTKRLAMDVDFYIINHDGITIKALAKQLRKRKDIDLVICDEVSAFRNADTDRYKFLEYVIERKPRFWPLSGAPCPNAPTDAWALTRLVDKSRVPQWFGSFKRKTMVQLSQFKWAPKPEAKRIAFEAMQPAVRFEKKDCLTLPPVITIDVKTSLTTAQKDAFNSMRSDMILDGRKGKITAVNAADKINKLRQILCGSIKETGTDNYVLIDHAARTQDLLDLIAQASAKVIVIVPFKGIIQSLAKELAPHYTVGVLNGDVSPGTRVQIISEFRFQTDPRVLLCHPKVMAHGLNLTVADTTIFYAPIYSNDEFQQVIERFNRAGQTNKMTIVRMWAHRIEREIYTMVEEKRLTQAGILKLYNEVTEAD